MQVSAVAVTRADPRYFAVRVIEDHIRADAMPVDDASLPPGQDASAPVVLHLEVPCGRVLPEPHQLPQVVDYHRAVLTGAHLQGYEAVSRRSAGLLRDHLDRGRALVGARVECPKALVGRR